MRLVELWGVSGLGCSLRYLLVVLEPHQYPKNMIVSLKRGTFIKVHPNFGKALIFLSCFSGFAFATYSTLNSDRRKREVSV